MICNTKRPGKNCSLMKKNGCSVIECFAVSEKCKDCKNVEKDNYCKFFVNPNVKHLAFGRCPMNTNKVIKIEEKHKTNPLKASKKKSRKSVSSILNK